MNNVPHLTALGVIYIAVGVLNLIVALAFFGTVGVQAVTSGDARAVLVTMTSDIQLVIASVSLLAGLLTLTGGIGLLKQKSWALGLVWVLACLALLNFPLGTALGVYALWVLSTREVRQALGDDGSGRTVMRAIKVTAALSLLLMLASYPACQFSEPIVQAELSKLSPEERELRQFDMVYMRWVLPGVLASLWGTMLAIVAIVSWIVERRRMRKNLTPHSAS